MNRRKLIKGLVGLTATVPINLKVQAQAKKEGLLLQQSSLAGFQFYQGEALWEQLEEGQSLILKREPENRYDERAVAVYWQHQKLGYVPRIDNAAISQLMDRGEPLSARIDQLKQSRNPWKRIGLIVYLI